MKQMPTPMHNTAPDGIARLFLMGMLLLLEKIDNTSCILCDSSHFVDVRSIRTAPNA